MSEESQSQTSGEYNVGIFVVDAYSCSDRGLIFYAHFMFAVFREDVLWGGHIS